MKIKKEDISHVFDGFSKLRVLIIGDVMLDEYLIGDVSRISPEAPVPIVNIRSRYACLGGAANVALNIKSLGATPILCSMIGEDKKSGEFLELMRKENLSLDGIGKSKSRILTTKYRAIGNKIQLLRLDSEITDALSQSDEENFLKILLSILDTQKIDAIIFEDYDKGVITSGLIDKIVAVAKEKSIITAVDPKRRNFSAYNNTDLFKPNLKELNEGLRLEKCTFDSDYLHDAVKQFMIEKQHKHLLLTLSENGIAIYTNKDNKFNYAHIPACMRNIADVSGAGDTVISMATLCMASGMDLEDVALFSNLAGGLVCEEVGVVAVNKEKLLNLVINY